MQTIENLRSISQIFSPPIFKTIVRENDTMLFEMQVEKYIATSNYHSNFEVIKSVYKSLQNHYRCEYIYKNAILNDILKKYGLKTTLTLNEFKIGASIADLVLLNSIVRVYEIKTELDGLDKLGKQIKDYQKFADEVYIVTDDKYAQKLLSIYKNKHIGIIALNRKNKFETIKAALKNEAQFEFGTIFKLLRKQEYLDLVFENYKIKPEVPNTKIFRTCFDLLSAVDKSVFQKQVLNKLKDRKLVSPEMLKSSKTPHELKQICNALDFNQQEYQRLYNFLAANKQILEESSLN